jgi:hypothetical protein
MTTTPRPPAKPRPFLLDLLIILAVVSLIGLVLQWLTSLSNTYFLAAVILWIVAIIPVFGEVGGNTKTSLQARKEGKKAREVIMQEEAAGKYSRGTRITFLYGLAGFVSFLLALLTL